MTYVKAKNLHPTITPPNHMLSLMQYIDNIEQIEGYYLCMFKQIPK